MISVAREMRNPVKAPVESILHAKKARKQSGVTDLSLQSKTPRTSSSILRIVLGSNKYFAPSICILYIMKLRRAIRTDMPIQPGSFNQRITLIILYMLIFYYV